MLMYQYPYGNAQQLNLDWLMEQWQTVKESIDGSLQNEIDRVESAITDLLNARDAAVAAANAAQASAGAAASSANTAAAQAAISTAQAAAATQERVNAANAANNAQTYANNALAQAVAAGNYAGNASTSANQAAASASDAHNDALAAAQDAADAHNDALAAAQDAADAQDAAALIDMNATAADIGKAIIVKSVADGKVSQYEFGEAGGGGGTPSIVNTIEDVSVAIFDDGIAAPINALMLDIVPVLSGTGNPSPNNVRAISGWTQENIYLANKNILPVTAYSGVGYNPSEGTSFSMSLQPDVTFSNGTITRTNVSSWGRMCLLSPPLKEGSYRVTGELQTNGIVTQIITLDESKKVKRIVSQNNSSATSVIIDTTVTLLPDEKYISFYVATNTGSTNLILIHPQIIYGTESAEYIDADNKIINVSFPVDANTVYGGTVDVINGILTVDTIFYELDGTESGWTKYGQTVVYNGNLARNTLPATGNALKGYCSHIPTLVNGNIDSTYLSHVNSGNGLQFNNVTTYYGLSDNNVATWTSYLAAQKANGTPIQIVAYLQTPITYSISPEEIVSFLNFNTIWADTGNINILEYAANSKKYIDEQDELIKALIAPVLSEMKADTALTVNDFRIVENILYKITASVAAGATLTPNTNCIATTIGEVLKTLLT